MLWKRRFRLPAALLALALAALVAGCVSPAGGPGTAGIRFTAGRMLHMQQVLERYDADGNPVPQYLELWLTGDRGRCSELDASGQEVAVALDAGGKHLYWDASTLQAEKTGASRLFVVSLGAMKKLYPKTEASGSGQYTGRECTLYLMCADGGDGWIKLYVDDATGCVLFCDAETFRLRTALVEDLPADGALFQAPEGLVFRGGDGK